MDANTAYWTAAWLNMLVLVGLAIAGARQAGQQHIDRHRRLMWTAVILVVVFVSSYGVKLAVLGREDLAVWERSFVHVLRVHELCVLVMVLAGATSLTLALRLELERPLGAPRIGLDAARLGRGVRIHRSAGWIAIGAGLLGVLTASYVLWGFYSRLGVA
jgi:uncharacterized membrane protein YozB (DUF420 family)